MRLIRHIGMIRYNRNEDGHQYWLLSLANFTFCNAALHLCNPNRSFGCTA
jgi:hypothetical protein